MADEKTYVFDGASRNDIPLAYALNNGGAWGNGLGGWGGGIVGFLLGLAFGGFGGWGGFGGFGGNGVSGLVNSDSNRDVVLQAINGTDADVRQLATTLGMNYETISQGISDARLALANVGAQVGMSGLQVQNAILSGDASIVAKLQECCCENRLLTTQQGYEAQIRTLEQTNQLGSQADRNANSIINAISAQTVAMNDQFCALKERELVNEIEALKTQLNNSNRAADKAEILSAVSAMINSLKTTTTSTTTNG